MALLLAMTMVLPGAIERTVAGSYRHGQWSGECFRDGTLRGMGDEICRARWAGNVDVRFDRDADRLSLLVSPRARAPSRCARGADIAALQLTGPARTERVARAIAAAIRALPAACRVPHRVTPIDRRDLAATLRETDGLIHVAALAPDHKVARRG